MLTNEYTKRGVFIAILVVIITGSLLSIFPILYNKNKDKYKDVILGSCEVTNTSYIESIHVGDKCGNTQCTYYDGTVEWKMNAGDKTYRVIQVWHNIFIPSIGARQNCWFYITIMFNNPDDSEKIIEGAVIPFVFGILVILCAIGYIVNYVTYQIKINRQHTMI